MTLAMFLSSCAAPALGPFYVGMHYGGLVSYGIHPGIDIETGSGTPIIAAYPSHCMWGLWKVTD